MVPHERNFAWPGSRVTSRVLGPQNGTLTVSGSTLQSFVMPALFTKMSGAPYFSVIASRGAQKKSELMAVLWKSQLVCSVYTRDNITNIERHNLHIQICRMGMRDIHVLIP